MCLDWGAALGQNGPVLPLAALAGLESKDIASQDDASQHRQPESLVASRP